jgi:hypothetical protein
VVEDRSGRRRKKRDVPTREPAFPPRTERATPAPLGMATSTPATITAHSRNEAIYTEGNFKNPNEEAQKLLLILQQAIFQLMATTTSQYPKKDFKRCC